MKHTYDGTANLKLGLLPRIAIQRPKRNIPDTGTAYRDKRIQWYLRFAKRWFMVRLSRKEEERTRENTVSSGGKEL